MELGEYNLTFATPPLKGEGKKSAQGREFKFYKEREGKKKEKMERKERGEERKRKRK